MCVHILLTNDAEIICGAIRNLLNERDDITIVGEAATFQEVIQKRPS